MSQHAGYARVAFNFALSSFKVSLDQDEWRSHIGIKREFNAVKYDKFDWCEDLSQNASKNAIHNLGDAVTRWKKGQNKFPSIRTEVVNALTKQIMAKELLKFVKSVSTFQR